MKAIQIEAFGYPVGPLIATGTLRGDQARGR
jgi:hypothetical protein